MQVKYTSCHNYEEKHLIQTSWKKIQSSNVWRICFEG